MMRFQTDKGVVTISSDVFTNIAGMAASNCFGVKGMAVRSVTDGLVHLLRREAMGKGVLVTYNEDESVTIDLHVVMDHGINNIVCVQPFACLPNHIVAKSMIKPIRKMYPKANIAAVDYDPGASEVNQLNRIKLMLSTAKKNIGLDG